MPPLLTVVRVYFVRLALEPARLHYLLDSSRRQSIELLPYSMATTVPHCRLSHASYYCAFRNQAFTKLIAPARPKSVEGKQVAEHFRYRNLHRLRFEQLQERLRTIDVRETATTGRAADCLPQTNLELLKLCPFCDDNCRQTHLIR